MAWYSLFPYQTGESSAAPKPLLSFHPEVVVW